MKRFYTVLGLLLVASYGLFAQIIINEVLYDPSNTSLNGDANGDGVYSQEGDAFIEIVNTGYTNFDISGYEIWDDTTTGSLVYTIPASTIIPPQGALVIFGGGTPTGSFGGAIVLADTGSAGLSLNNSGEVIAIKDAAGNVVLTFDSDALSDNPNESYTRNPDITGSFEQHATNTALLFSPGTKVDGSSFNTNYAKDITFSVNMADYTGGAYTQMYVSGDFNGWCGTCNTLTDNGNGVWSTTLPISNDSIEYKFTMDDWAIQEEFSGGESCTKTTGGFTNRFAVLNGDIVLPTVCFASCDICTSHTLSLKGILDFTTPVGGNSGKAVHVVADGDISDLSLYGIGVANNGGGTDGQEYTFPAVSVTSGQNILVVRDSQALADYFADCWSAFDVVFVDLDGGISQNGDDAIELFYTGAVIETFADIDVDGTGEAWEYTDAWAFKEASGTWIYGAPDCTDGTTTIYDADCKYPFCPDLEVMVETITVTGDAGATTISVNDGTLQMVATITPTNATDATVAWSVNDENIATIDANGLLTPIRNGSVTVTATANDGSGVSGNAIITITNQVTSVEDVYASSISLYPNPTSSVLKVITAAPISSYTIYTAEGKTMDQSNLINNQIDVSALPTGIYFIELSIDNLAIQKRFIKN